MADTTHVITAHEDEQIQHANASGLQPVVFVHGVADTALAFVKRFV